ncbi:phosphomannomutase CpsG [Temperatibacter marinus]|uniref:Phosphomannomutase CpsG n=1 Tax=Temperatibacter marinus TaxID=1456591 RepID=A0AA52HAX4_9PROT|nr:phosphomannomutase CpsG [Temperatibacter marinus]WND03185.1 phosphomannomutase CpsG [Temperatibacter marinus]
MKPITCFKAYDLRGKLEEQLDNDVAYRVGRAFGQYLEAKKIVVGCDARSSSEPLKKALIEGLLDSGTDVVDIGQTGTEEVYFATSFLDCCGGIEVTASHNPIDYNGMKFVRENSKPISLDSGLKDIKEMAEQEKWPSDKERGSLSEQSVLDDYVTHLLGYIDHQKLSPMKIVVDSGNGVSGHVIDAIEERFQKTNVPIEFVKINHEPDSTFPNGIPNPMIEDNRTMTIQAVIDSGADIGIAWDGDFDRCFFYDEQGTFLDGYYIVGLLSEAFLAKSTESAVIFDPRTYWNTLDIAATAGGEAVMSKCGHSFIKEKMREIDAVYGGEMSAHHYFRDFYYCDSGMIPWLLIIELLSQKKQAFSTVLTDRIEKFPSSGEINFKVNDPDQIIQTILDHEYHEEYSLNELDGIDLIFKEWRFNLRKSNTEPVIRLNMEARGDQDLLEAKLKMIVDLIKQ